MKSINIIGTYLLAMCLVGCSSRGHFPTATRSAPITLAAYPRKQNENIRTYHVYDQYNIQVITFQTSDTPEDVIIFYKKELTQNGWKIFSQDAQRYMSSVNEQACPQYSFYITNKVTSPNITNVEVRLVPSRCVAM